MTRIKAALLAAAVVAGLPGIAFAQDRPEHDGGSHDRGGREQRGDQNDHHGDGQHNDRGNVQQSQQAQARPPVQPIQQQQPARDQRGEQFRSRQQVPQQQADAERREQFRGDRGGRGNDRRDDGRGQFHSQPYGGGRDDRFAGGNRPGGDWRQDRRYDWRGYRDQHREVFRAQRYAVPRGWSYGYRRFSVGARLPGFFFGEQYWIDDPSEYRLPPAYGPYRWVRYYDDVILVDLRTGMVVDEVPGFFF